MKTYNRPNILREPVDRLRSGRGSNECDDGPNDHKKDITNGAQDYGEEDSVENVEDRIRDWVCDDTHHANRPVKNM